MVKLVVSEFVTLDGVLEDTRWTFEYHGRHPWTPDQLKFKYDELFGSDALLLGRVTYQGFAASWPSQQDDPEGYGKRMNSLPKYVVSNTLDKAEWTNSRLIKGNLVEEVMKLKNQPGNDLLVFGSLSLAGELIQRGLVDELRFMVYPVFQGKGKRFFSEASPSIRPNLLEARGLDSGVTVLRYGFEKGAGAPQPI
jgi:dihydrofolate reductase